jgi:hypothetical protein
LEQYVRAFSAKHLNLLILLGGPGLAKNQMVRRLIGEQACWIEGNATAFGMYLALWRHTAIIWLGILVPGIIAGLPYRGFAVQRYRGNVQLGCARRKRFGLRDVRRSHHAMSELDAECLDRGCYG